MLRVFIFILTVLGAMSASAESDSGLPLDKRLYYTSGMCFMWADTVVAQDPSHELYDQVEAALNRAALSHRRIRSIVEGQQYAAGYTQRDEVWDKIREDNAPIWERLRNVFPDAFFERCTNRFF